MGLLEVKKEIEEQLKTALETESKEEVIEQELTKEEPVVEEEKLETAVVEEKPEEAAVEEEKPDSSAFARMRREKKAAERLAQERDEEIQALRARVPREEVSFDPIKETAKPDPLIDAIKDRYIQELASEEVMAYEREFKSTVTDYDEVSKAYVNELIKSVRVRNPRMDNAEVAKIAKKEFLQTAAMYEQKKLNPIEEMYHDAIALGIKPQKKQETVEDDPRPDLKKIAANKAKNAGTVTAKGMGGAQITRESVGKLTNAEYMKLPKAQRMAYLKGQN